MADFRNDDLEDILAGMLDEQDRRNGRQSSAAKPPELPRRGDAPAAPAAPVPEDEDAELARLQAALSAGKPLSRAERIRLNELLDQRLNELAAHIAQTKAAQTSSSPADEPEPVEAEEPDSPKEYGSLAEALAALWGETEESDSHPEPAAPRHTPAAGTPSFAARAHDSREARQPVRSAAPAPTGTPQATTLMGLTDKVRTMQETLLAKVAGQDHAVYAFVSGYFQAQVMAMADRERTKPLATFLFTGSPGVGKTYLAEQAAQLLDLPYRRFDMSEYSDKDAGQLFAGSNKVFKDSAPGLVTEFVSKNPHCVLLFDEIEKAHLNVIHLFLQILDRGFLRDNHTNQEVPFRDAVIILTTNAGRQLYSDPTHRNLADVSRKTILKALADDVSDVTGEPAFPAAICSRFASGNVILFNHLEAQHLYSIVCDRIETARHQLEAAYHLSIKMNSAVMATVLFAEGGLADARTVSARAEHFLLGELFELMRLMAEHGQAADRLRTVRFSVDMGDDPAIRSLYGSGREAEMLLFTQLLPEGDHRFPNVLAHVFHRPEPALALLKERDILAVFVEPTRGSEPYLNLEDMDSPALTFFNQVHERFPQVPLYLLQTPDARINKEERLSFARRGCRKVFTTTGAGLPAILHTAYLNTQRQLSMNELARSNQVITFETAQTLEADGQTAHIQLFRLRRKRAVQAQDAQKLLSDVSRPDVRFADVIGAADAKEELRFFADYLSNPRKYSAAGLRNPKGLLLYGPPGTGKTMLAKAMAGETGMAFLAAKGGQFLQKYVGEGPKAVHELFQTARRYAPSILFIDEIDAIARPRTGDDTQHTGKEVLNALLTEMDGFRGDDPQPVFVIAATNFGVDGSSDSLDSALVRRFDRAVLVELPSQSERLEFLTRARDKNPALALSDSALRSMASRTPGMSLANLDSVIALALRTALRQNRSAVDDALFAEALDTFQSGKEKQWSPDELLRTARHEAGHAYVCWQGGGEPNYLTIVARSGYGGYMQQASQEEKGSYSREELRARIRTCLAGRAAEIAYYGEEAGLTTGASGDLKNATRLARNMLTTYGMDDQFGLASLSGKELDGPLGEKLYNQVNAMLTQELANTVEIIRKGMPTMDRLVNALMQESHMDGSRMKEIFEGRS